MGLRVERLAKGFGTVRAVDDVTLDVPSGTTLALLGPSGCGKSTLLSLIAGLEKPDAGTVRLDGEDVTRLPPQRRDLGMVFQDFALFPHLSVEGNVAFGLVEKRWDAGARRTRVAELLALVGLPGLGTRRVDELSGGQQQRVALARAMAPAPGLLLLDEPLSNLDEAMRNELRDEVARLLDDLDAEAVYVTHDQAEAFAVADAVAVMRAGRIVQVGRPEALLSEPADAWTARFLGHENVWEGHAAAEIALAAGVGKGGGRAGAVTPSSPQATGLLLRMEDVRLLPATGDRREEYGGSARGSSPGASPEAVVRSAMREGLAWRLELHVPAWDASVTWRGHRRELGDDPSEGASYVMNVPPTAWQVLPEVGNPSPTPAAPPKP